ncbi:MAG: septation protein IspZ [Alphaproteobacteria bacterium]|nr:septation protein IspZ [Alphaproteobacteria bacterium]
MKDLLYSARAVLADMVATLFFLALYALTHSILWAVAAGLALALGQIGWQLLRGRAVDALQWIGLVVIASLGSATLVSGNPLFVMLKPSLIYCLVGAAMLKRGWMLKYMPERALASVSDLAISFGYVWAGLMFFSAALNFAVAQHTTVLAWAAFMGIYATASKIALFALQYGTMKMIGKRRYYARQKALMTAA